jgi:hypothetical protein
MARQFQLPAQAQIVQALNPAADAAGRTSQYVTLKAAHKAYIICHITQGNAATILLTPLQAQDVSGTNSKALTNNCAIWVCTDESVTDALVKQAAAANYTTDAGVKNKVVVFEISAQDHMDEANGFKTIGLSTGASNAANITQAMFILTPLRYEQATPPSAIVN